jgi:predicted nucleic acid-binding protein
MVNVQQLLFLSAATISEIEAGAAKLNRSGAKKRAERISHWLDGVISLFGPRILSLDIAVARVAGVLLDKARAIGFEPGIADVMIAATAVRHDFVLLTRNVRHFAPFGMPIHDPFSRLPDEL